MRHGRKSKSKRPNGYKRHIAGHLDADLILACAITPANRPEEEAAPLLQRDIELQGLSIDELYIDRGYINASTVDEVLGRGGDVVCKPWVPRNSNSKAFTKADFRLNLRDFTIQCPGGETEDLRAGSVVEFDPEACQRCKQRCRCTMAGAGHGRTVTIAASEKLQQRLRKRIATSRGRQRVRAHEGPKAHAWRAVVRHAGAGLGRELVWDVSYLTGTASGSSQGRNGQCCPRSSRGKSRGFCSSLLSLELWGDCAPPGANRPRIGLVVRLVRAQRSAALQQTKAAVCAFGLARVGEGFGQSGWSRPWAPRCRRPSARDSSLW